MKILSNKLLSLQDKTDCVDMDEYKKVHLDLAVMQEDEDLRWRQHAKEEWLKFGDQNSKFFHASANQKRKANIIAQISDEVEQVWTSPDDIGAAFVGYFQRLFTTEAPTNMQKVLSVVKRKVTPAMNNFLLREFTGEEVNEALNQMASLKAPGPDGFSVCFFQKNWAAVGMEVSQAVLDILRIGNLNKELNLTYIALILKKKSTLLVCLNSALLVFAMCFIRLYPRCLQID